MNQLEEHISVEPYIHMHKDINEKMIELITDWLNGISKILNLKEITFHQSIYIMHRFLSSNRINRNKLQIIGCSCLYISACCNEIFHPTIDDYISISDNAYNCADMIEMVRNIFQKIDYVAFFPVPVLFIDEKLLNKEISECNTDQSAVIKIAKCMALVILQHVELIKYKPSILADACIYIAEYININKICSSISDLTFGIKLPSNDDFTKVILDVLKHLNVETKYVSARYDKNDTWKSINKILLVVLESFIRGVMKNKVSENKVSENKVSENNNNIHELSPICTNDNFELIEKIGEGTFGAVYTAVEKNTNKRVVIKKYGLGGDDCICYTLLRESNILYILNKFPHENLISNSTVIYHDDRFKIIMPHTGISYYNYKKNIKYKPDHLMLRKSIIYQLLSAVEHLHKYNICHRDISVNNITIDKNGKVTLIDYGSSRIYNFDDKTDCSDQVCTIWFRPIEFLLGLKRFGKAQDIWSIGCILLYSLDKNLIAGDSEIHQIFKFLELLGSIDVPVLKSLPEWKSTFPQWTCKVESITSDVNEQDLIKKLLNYDYDRRISAHDALSHPYFDDIPKQYYGDISDSFIELIEESEPKELDESEPKELDI
jgi:hypothetical protein